VRHQEQLYIECNAVCAVPGPDGGMQLFGSMQCPFYIHKALKRLLAIGDDKWRDPDRHRTAASAARKSTPR